MMDLVVASDIYSKACHKRFCLQHYRYILWTQR